MEFEQKVLEFLKDREWRGGQDMNPVEVDRGITYVKHDGIRISNITDSIGGVLLQFTYRGAAVAWIRFHGVALNTFKNVASGEVSGRHRMIPANN